MSSSPATGPSAELIRYTHGSTRIVRTCRPCVTPVLLTTRGSAHRPRSIGCPAYMNANCSSSPEEESATGRPDRNPPATEDGPAKGDSHEDHTFFDSAHQLDDRFRWHRGDADATARELADARPAGRR